MFSIIINQNKNNWLEVFTTRFIEELIIYFNLLWKGGMIFPILTILKIIFLENSPILYVIIALALHV